MRYIAATFIFVLIVAVCLFVALSAIMLPPDAQDRIGEPLDRSQED